MVSDVELDSHGQPLPSMSWRSNHVDESFQRLDEGYKQLARTPRAKINHNDKIKKIKPDRHNSKAPGFGNIPNKNPSNWMAPDAMESLKEVEKRGIKLQEPVDLSPQIEHLRAMTRRPTVNQYSFMQI
ncbi:hypothetical protein O181_016878 [Austropuccinia psidii MF-1]|uniref:Uncharacterized protein n=1 Tax=Austropuccinia psidii MF-1 TaxID=1389203 RepID=A0A9Q3C631_9BASI|nr:hypothetical protein [Austropuccinia psidii MF-1]